MTTFTYDGDGRRVKWHTVTDTIVYVGSHYEEHIPQHDLNDDCLVNMVDIMLVVACWSCESGDACYESRYDFDNDDDIDIADIMTVAGHWREKCTTVKYYTLGGRRVAMREDNTLYYLFSDHLGSTSVVYDTGKDTWTTQRYYPYGRTRSGEVPTDRLFTGQRFDGTIGLYDYGARFYDPALGRFISADTIVPEPGNPQALNRYSYVLNNPLRYVDPTGHQGKPRCDYDLWISEWRLAVALNATPGLQVSRSRQEISQVLDRAQLGLDAIESVISIVGTATSMGVLTIGGVAALFEPTPFGEGAAVLAAWASTISADTFEDIPGSVDVLVNIAGDIAGGSTYRDTSTNEWVIGQDTLITVLEQAWDFAVPSVWFDLVLNAGGTAYDLTKVMGKMPNFLEMRIPIAPDTGLPLLSENYLVLYPDALGDSPARSAVLDLLGLQRPPPSRRVPRRR